MTQPGTGKYERLLERCRGIEPIATAVAYPCDESSLSGAVDAAKLGLIVPILVGPAAKIAEVAKAKGINLSEFQVVDAPTAARPRPRPWNWFASAKPSW
jgi:phosphotransacetylase